MLAVFITTNLVGKYFSIDTWIGRFRRDPPFLNELFGAGCFSAGITEFIKTSLHGDYSKFPIELYSTVVSS